MTDLAQRYQVHVNQICAWKKQLQVQSGVRRGRRLMRQMGIATLGPKPRTTKPVPGHKIFPYLLRLGVIDRPNQVLAADITYVPVGQGFLYLVAIIDWVSRAVLARRLSNTMNISFCASALKDVLRFGRSYAGFWVMR